MTRYRYINTSIQKGWIPENFAFVEHSSMPVHREDQYDERRLDLCVVNLGYSYGSVPHEVIKMFHWHNPAHVVNIISG